MGFGRPATAVEAGEAAAEERCHGNVVVDEGDRMSVFGDHCTGRKMFAGMFETRWLWTGWMDFEVKSG